MAPILVRLLACFALGSIPFAVISMAGSGIDIRKVGSGNPGFNNVLRVSKPRAVVALIGDMGKGYLAVWLMVKAWPLTGPAASGPNVIDWGWVFGFAAVLGHCYSPLLRFNGGKGVATSGGVMLMLYPKWAIIALVYFAVARIALGKLKWREAGALASLTTWLLFTVLTLIFVNSIDAAYSAVMTLFLIWRHSKNLGNLWRSGEAVAAKQ
jgi:glycerol-3-phosphate acyltransferase PlsY